MSKFGIFGRNFLKTRTPQTTKGKPPLTDTPKETKVADNVEGESFQSKPAEENQQYSFKDKLKLAVRGAGHGFEDWGAKGLLSGFNTGAILGLLTGIGVGVAAMVTAPTLGVAVASGLIGIPLMGFTVGGCGAAFGAVAGGAIGVVSGVCNGIVAGLSAGNETINGPYKPAFA